MRPTLIGLLMFLCITHMCCFGGAHVCKNLFHPSSMMNLFSVINCRRCSKKIHVDLCFISMLHCTILVEKLCTFISFAILISLSHPCIYERGNIKVWEWVIELRTKPLFARVARGMGHVSLCMLIKGGCEWLMWVVDAGSDCMH